MTAWFDAKNLDEEKAADRAASTRRRSTTSSTCRPASSYGYQAWRKNVTGVVKGPLPFFWGVAKA